MRRIPGFPPSIPWWSHERVVYGLAGPDGVIVYVGCTRHLTARVSQHRSLARCGNPRPLYQWMRSVGLGSVAVVVIHPEGSCAVEVAEIRSRLDAGEPLFNSRPRVRNREAAA